MPVTLLTTIGAKTGTSRTHPVIYLIDDGRLILVGRTLAAQTNPAGLTIWLATVHVWEDYAARAGNRTIPLIRLERLDFQGP